MCISGGVSWENVIYPLRRLSGGWVVVPWWLYRAKSIYENGTGGRWME